MTVKQVFTGDITQLEGSYRKLMQQQELMDAKLQKLAENSARGSKQTAEGLQTITGTINAGVSGVQNLAAQWVSFGAIIAGVRAEAEEFNAVQQEASDEMRGIGQSQSKLLFNLAGLPQQTVKDFLGRIDAIQKENQISDVKMLYMAANAGLAATGQNLQITGDVVNAAARLGRNSPEDLEAITLGAATIQQTIGGNVSAEQSLAFQSTAGGPSYITDPAQQARYIPAMVKNVMETLPQNARDTPEKRMQAAKEIAAFASALGNVAGDTEGMSTRTEAIDLFGELEDFFTKGVDYEVGGRKFKRKPKVDPGTIQGRVEYLQQNERERKLFMAQTTNEIKFSVARRELLNGGVTADLAKANLPQISFDRKAYDDLAELQKTGTPEIRQANRAGDTEGSRQRRRRDELNGIQADARTIRDEALKQTRQYGGPYYGTKFMTDWSSGIVDDIVGRDRVDAGIQDLEYRRNSILFPGSLLGGRDRLTSARSEEQLSPKERQDYEFLGEELRRLRELQLQQQDLQKQQLDEAKRQTQVLQTQDRPTADPGAARGEIGGQRER